MDKNYFQVNFDGSVKAISKQAYLKKYDTVEAGDSDVILWYDDGINIFIGHCACDIKSPNSDILIHIEPKPILSS